MVRSRSGPDGSEFYITDAAARLGAGTTMTDRERCQSCGIPEQHGIARETCRRRAEKSDQPLEDQPPAACEQRCLFRVVLKLAFSELPFIGAASIGAVGLLISISEWRRPIRQIFLVGLHRFRGRPVAKWKKFDGRRPMRSS